MLKTTYTGAGVEQDGANLNNPGVKGVFWSKADANPHQYTVSNGVCSVTLSKSTKNGAPNDIVFAAATGTPAGLPGQGGGNGLQGSYNNSGAGISGVTSAGPALTCHQTKDFGNTWVTYIDNVNNAVVEINNNGQDLDSVAVSVYREPLLPSVLNATGAAGACYQYPEYAMERHFVIQSTKSTGANSFASNVGVRLYFSDAELQDLIYWTNHNATASAGTVNASCAAAEVVNNTGMLYVTKYTDPNPTTVNYTNTEDGNYSNNNPSGIYRMFGPGVTTLGAPFTGIDGQSGVFSSSLGANRHYVEFNVREFSELWLSGSGDIEPLPVEMIYFEAEAINNEYIQLAWATDIEINNKEFQIERSTDGQNWTQIGIVDGNGNSTVKQTYTYNDVNVVPEVHYYYRLKQVDFNLEYKYTGVVSAAIYGNAAFSISISPNPTYGTTNLIINTTKEQAVSVEVYDMLGQKAATSNNQLVNGYNRIELDLNRLAAGTYTVSVTSANQVYTKKLVIAK